MKAALLVAGALALLAVATALFALRAALAPLPGEWSVPLALGPLTVQAGVPSAIRLATSAWAGPLLHGRGLATRHGRLQFAWADGALQVRCAPCLLQPAALGEAPLHLPEVRLHVRREADHLAGEFTAGAVHGRWHGQLAPGQLRLHLAVPETPIADGYALFAAQIPELAHARIGGRFSLQAQLLLPGGRLRLQPRLAGFEVDGLGTEALLGARSSCSRRASRLTPDSWLARAVVAAEDRRFWEHPGYDLAEVAAALARNQDAQRIERGASTLSQQVAKLLVTGDERSPARKLRELLYAVEAERTLGKARLLRLYLDTVPWGSGLCGAEAAARHYFGVPARSLTPAQASWLAAMLHNPELEARRWAGSGQIDLARAQWVALALSGLSRSGRLALAQDLAQLDWTPRWAEPAEPTAGKDKPVTL